MIVQLCAHVHISKGAGACICCTCLPHGHMGPCRQLCKQAVAKQHRCTHALPLIIPWLERSVRARAQAASLGFAGQGRVLWLGLCYHSKCTGQTVPVHQQCHTSGRAARTMTAQVHQPGHHLWLHLSAAEAVLSMQPAARPGGACGWWQAAPAAAPGYCTMQRLLHHPPTCRSVAGGLQGNDAARCAGTCRLSGQAACALC